MTFSYLHRYAALVHFFHLSRAVTPWLGAATLLLFGLGLLGGLVLAPADYQQGDSFRIIYVHVPAAWMSLFVYVVMAASGAIGLVWKVKLGEIICRCAAPLGAGYTALALASGALWGKPMWGTWWVWDARLTSELILLLLYLGVLALHGAFEERRVAARAGAILAVIGVINVPIIHYSVEWWSTLHQGPTVTKFEKPSIHIDMLIPLMVMFAAIMCHFAWGLLLRARGEILHYERNASWVRDLHGRR